MISAIFTENIKISQIIIIKFPEISQRKFLKCSESCFRKVRREFFKELEVIQNRRNPFYIGVRTHVGRCRPRKRGGTPSRTSRRAPSPRGTCGAAREIPCQGSRFLLCFVFLRNGPARRGQRDPLLGLAVPPLFCLFTERPRATRRLSNRIELKRLKLKRGDVSKPNFA